MVGLVQVLTQTEILLESNILRAIIAAYIYLILIIFVSFLNIYSVDKIEYLNNKQICFQFKHKLFFIIMYSKNKRFVSKKTFIAETVGYLLSITSIIVFIYSLNLYVDVACILLGIVYFVVSIFGCITGTMYYKIKKYKDSSSKNHLIYKNNNSNYYVKQKLDKNKNNNFRYTHFDSYNKIIHYVQLDCINVDYISIEQLFLPDISFDNGFSEYEYNIYLYSFSNN